MLCPASCATSHLKTQGIFQVRTCQTRVTPAVFFMCRRETPDLIIVDICFEFQSSCPKPFLCKYRKRDNTHLI